MISVHVETLVGGRVELVAAVAVVDAVRVGVVAAVDAARADGVRWVDIAEALGHRSPQSVQAWHQRAKAGRS